MKEVTRPLADRSEGARPADNQAGRALLNWDRPTATEGDPEARVADPTRLVKVAADALTVLRGCVLTITVARILADVLIVDLPWVPLADLVDLVAPKMHIGSVLDDDLINERARQIATVALVLR